MTTLDMGNGSQVWQISHDAHFNSDNLHMGPSISQELDDGSLMMASCGGTKLFFYVPIMKFTDKNTFTSGPDYKVMTWTKYKSYNNAMTL